MKNLILLTVILVSLVACKKTATGTINRSIIGKWKLSESLADPGDGGGTWQPVNSSNITRGCIEACGGKYIPVDF